MIHSCLLVFTVQSRSEYYMCYGSFYPAASCVIVPSEKWYLSLGLSGDLRVTLQTYCVELAFLLLLHAEKLYTTPIPLGCHNVF